MEIDMIKLIQVLYRNNINSQFTSDKGLKQDQKLNPLLVSVVVDEAIRKSKNRCKNM